MKQYTQCKAALPGESKSRCGFPADEKISNFTMYNFATGMSNGIEQTKSLSLLHIKD